MKKKMTDSQFNLIRGAIAVAYADGKLMDVERNWLRWYMDKLDINKNKKEILAGDMINGIEIEEVLPKITDEHDRDMFMNFAHIIFKIDGEYHPSEKAMMKTIKRILKYPIEEKVSTEYLKEEKVEESIEKPEDFKSTEVTKAFELLIDRVFDVE